MRARTFLTAAVLSASALVLSGCMPSPAGPVRDDAAVAAAEEDAAQDGGGADAAEEADDGVTRVTGGGSGRFALRAADGTEGGVTLAWSTASDELPETLPAACVPEGDVVTHVAAFTVALEGGSGAEWASDLVMKPQASAPEGAVEQIVVCVEGVGEPDVSEAPTFVLNTTRPVETVYVLYPVAAQNDGGALAGQALRLQIDTAESGVDFCRPTGATVVPAPCTLAWPG